MRRRSVASLVLFLALIGAFLVFPALASATTVSGTVTDATTGAKLEGIRVGGSYWIDDMSGSWGISEDVTDVNGEYTVSFSPGQQVYCIIAARSITGTYDGQASDEMVVQDSDTKTADFALKKDADEPLPDVYLESYMYASAASLGLEASALPDEVLDWALLTNGLDPVWAAADDGQYFSRPHYGFMNGSGIQKIGYAVDGGPWTWVMDTDFDYVNTWDSRYIGARKRIPVMPDGAHTVSVRATDNNGNASGVRTRLVVVDSKPPYTTYNKKTATTRQIKLTASDAVSGVLGTFVRTGTSGPFALGATSISVPSKGYKDIQFYSTDKIGNTETVRKLRVSAPASLSTPKPSTGSVSNTKRFTVRGKVYRRSGASGYLRIYKRKGGTYKYIGKKAFTEGSDGVYRVSLKLGEGSYRFKAAYGSYSTTWANPPVRSAMSSRVRVY